MNNYQKPYKVKRFFPKENYLSKEDAKKLKDWLTVGYVGSYIDSSQPFSRLKEIQTLLKKHPQGFRKIINDNIKNVDKNIIIYAMACVLTSGKEGKHVLNDIFLKYIKTLEDLYYFVSYAKELKSINTNLTPYITKFVRSQSFEKIHKEILMYQNHVSDINFSFLINKCGLTPRNEKEALYFKYILNPKMKCPIPIIEDYNLLKKNKTPKHLEKFNFEMLPKKEYASAVVKQTSINTILDNMDKFKEIDSIKYVEKLSTKYFNKYLAAKAYNDCDNAVKHIITETLKEKKSRKKICNIIDYDLAGVNNVIQARNIPFIFAQQFEDCENIIFETHDRFKSVNLDIEAVLGDNSELSVKLRDNTVIYFDNFIGRLMEKEKKVDTFIVWTYGKEFTLKKRPEMLDIYKTYCGRDVKIVFIYFNNQSDYITTSEDVLKINGFNIYRTEEVIKRFIYGDI